MAASLAGMPKVGLGLWKIPRDKAASVVGTAVRGGWRHFDSACDYGNEREVGEGLKGAISAGDCTREQLFVTSKLWNTFHAREHVRPACERTLADLGLEYLDLYLMHFPISQPFVDFEERYPPEWVSPETGKMELADVPIRETWEAMEGLVDAGLVRNIGVCNFTVQGLGDLLRYARVRPAVLQVEMHPYLGQDKLLAYASENGVHVTAFSPLGAGSYVELGMDRGLGKGALGEDAVRGVAERHGKTPAQVLLRWGIQRGTSVIPKTTKAERLSENLDVEGFELSAEDMAAISALDRDLRFNDPGEFCKGMGMPNGYPIYN